LKPSKTFAVFSDTAGSDRLVMMSRTDQKLDLASRIEAKASAWTVEDLADLLELSPKTLYKMANSGRISVIRIGGMLRFDPVLTANWLRARTTGPSLRKAA
jgi:excisionase family DNA binding protein